MAVLENMMTSLHLHGHAGLFACAFRTPRVVLLDEPAVGLSVNRVEELDALLRRIRDERGVTIIMIEHVIRLVMGVSDHIVVMNSGRKIAEGTADEVRDNPDVITAYVGNQADQH